MGYSSDFAEGARTAGGSDVGSKPLREDWAMARDALMDLQLARMPRVNLLLIGADGVTQNALNMLLPGLRTPIETCRASERLALPSSTQAGTMILRDVDALTTDDQHRLLNWLELCVGRTQVVSTTGSPLLSRVEEGGFLDTLYYRLNTVCVDVRG
jgi:hypothetical protein